MNEITVYYLEMTSPAQHNEKPAANGLQLQESLVKQGKVNRFLYDLVGEDWQWLDKQTWTSERWEEYACAENLRTWIAYCEGSIAGYFELQKNNEKDTELAYFGLAPAFVGRGFGGFLLSQAITTAWAWSNTDRIIVNTCTLDHPGALANYKARGFQVYEEKTHSPNAE